MDDKRFRDLETDSAIIKRELGHFGTLFAKLDITIDKISNLLNETNKILAVQEERIDYLQSVDKDNENKSLKNTDEIRNLLGKIESTNMYLLGEITNCEVNLKNDLKSLIESQDKRFKEQNESIEKMSEKVNHLERWKWMVIGFAVIAGWMIEHAPAIMDIGSRVK